MGRRGRKPLYAKREAYARLIAEGVPSARACRMVGVCRRTGTRWRNGRRLVSGGRLLNLPPVITVNPKPEKRYSPRDLSDDERIRLADLRHVRRTMREIATLMGRPRRSAVSSGGASTPLGAIGRSGPTGGRSDAAASIGPAASPATRGCVSGSRTGSRRVGARSRSPAACPASCPGECCTCAAVNALRAAMPRPAARARSPA